MEQVIRLLHRFVRHLGIFGHPSRFWFRFGARVGTEERDARLPIRPLLISQVISAPYRARIWSFLPEFRRHGALGGTGPRSAKECAGDVHQRNRYRAEGMRPVTGGGENIKLV